MQFIFFLVAFLACIVGSICGMGGGVIIKPVLDATGLLNVSTINFLSGCTVIGMTTWSVGKTLAKKETVIDLSKTTWLAIGAALGGLAGKELFNHVASFFPDPNTAGGVQAILLFSATLATLIYTVNKAKLQSKQVENVFIMLIIGLFLGILGAFLGIGGGPFNVAVLFYFFSMPTKIATQNSLYIVLFSQLFSTGKTVLSGKTPEFELFLLLGMVLCGILGSEVGRRINKKLSDKQATYLFEASMVLIMGINIYNIIQFFFI